MLQLLQNAEDHVLTIFARLIIFHSFELAEQCLLNISLLHDGSVSRLL